MAPGHPSRRRWRGRLDSLAGPWLSSSTHTRRSDEGDRRGFIHTAAVSTAAVALGSRADVSAGQTANTFSLNPKPLKLGLMTYQVGQSWDIPTLTKTCIETNSSTSSSAPRTSTASSSRCPSPSARTSSSALPMPDSPSAWRAPISFTRRIRRSRGKTSKEPSSSFSSPRTSGRLVYAYLPTPCPPRAIRTGKDPRTDWQVGVRGRDGGPQSWRAASAGRARDRDFIHSRD